MYNEFTRTEYNYLDKKNCYIELKDRQRNSLDDEREKRVVAWASEKGIKIDFMYRKDAEDCLEFSYRLRDALKKKKANVDTLALKIGIPRSTFHRYVTGTTKKIPYDRLAKIASYIKVDINDLLGVNDSIAALEKYTERDHIRKFILDELEDQNEGALTTLEKLMLKLVKSDRLNPEDYDKILDYAELIEKSKNGW